ncbi:MAG: hypothetical protein M3Q19_07275 [Pseudomonadota bacterium]|nr:hypothetical protein [Pseudomonadota bacterium]
MAKQPQSGKTPSQSDKFKAAAKEHGADLSAKRWDERLKKVVGPLAASPREHKPTGLTPSKAKKAKPEKPE